ncbi:hypothetical protein IQ254_17305 [Nodosilinea sp. LEGE 07088]|uniref:hypothetical protein n=1 Tax=Nodosilinea sp. LEGE 07088 TaxID=2777968 RepID=UPI00187EF42F|nr:hypothetical protein [Nodosilinea sp. LEGE 07088]MBE9138929.1 hypothetical protein [Nodosilinea sp. LEGE 07088]
MARFLTRRYVAVTGAEAIRLAGLDGTPWAEIRHDGDVQLLHRKEWWAWWSDGQLTTAIGLPESLCPQSLSPDAIALISEVWESNAMAPHCGWATLAQVEEVLSRERQLQPESTGAYQWVTLEVLTVRFTDDSEGVFHCWYRGYDEGFECQIELIRVGGF